MANILLLEAALSFTGFGVQAPQPSWGGNLRSVQTLLTSGSGYIIEIIGVLLFVTAFCLFLESQREYRSQ